jgi:hypothetical protein
MLLAARASATTKISKRDDEGDPSARPSSTADHAKLVFHQSDYQG